MSYFDEIMEDLKEQPPQQESASYFDEITAGSVIPEVRGPKRPLTDIPFQMLQGATLGASDELMGSMAGYATRGTPYGGTEMMENVAARERARVKQFRHDYPLGSFAAEAAGAMATGGLTAPKVASIPRWMAGAGQGAALGGAYGALAADPGERLAGAGWGAALGGALTPAGGVILNATGRLIGAAKRGILEKVFNSPRGQARRIIRDALRNETLSADDALAIVKELGDDALLADVSEGTRALARGAYARSPFARKMARMALESRQKGLGGRVMSIVGREVGDPAQFRPYLRKVAQDMRAKAKPLYDKVYRQAVDMMPDDFMNRPMVKQAMRQGAKIAADEGEEVVGNVKALDYLQRGLGEIARNAKAGTQRQAIAYQNQRAVLDHLDQVPGFSIARQIWRGGKAAERAADLGKKIFRGDVDDIAEQVADMSQSELQSFRLGVMRAVAQKVKTTSDTGNPIKKIVGNARNREALELAFPEGEFNKTLGRLAGEEAKTRTFSEILQGSRTGMLEAEKDLIDSGVLSTIRNSSDTASAAANLLKKYGFGDQSDDVLEELSKLLFMSPDQRTIMAVTKPAPKLLAPISEPQAGYGAAAGLTGAGSAQSYRD